MFHITSHRIVLPSCPHSSFAYRGSTCTDAFKLKVVIVTCVDAYGSHESYDMISPARTSREFAHSNERCKDVSGNIYDIIVRTCSLSSYVEHERAHDSIRAARTRRLPKPKHLCVRLCARGVHMMIGCNTILQDPLK